MISDHYEVDDPNDTELTAERIEMVQKTWKQIENIGNWTNWNKLETCTCIHMKYGNYEVRDPTLTTMNTNTNEQHNSLLWDFGRCFKRTVLVEVGNVAH